MNETETVSAAEDRPAKPGARRYYVWQVAMWMTVLHTATMASVVAMFPLPVTMLAMLLTIERKKRLPAAEACA